MAQQNQQQEQQQLLEEQRQRDAESDSYLYPPIDPYHEGTLAVSDIHTMGYEQCGNPKGLPILFVHGGPGGICEPRDRRFFDPAVYRIVNYEQRGSGRSTPKACIEDHNTWELVKDIEKLREHLGIEKWIVFGGSWGSTLGLVYTETHPDRVLALVVFGIFTLRPFELKWFYQEGASFLMPEAWEKYLAPIPEAERSDLMAAYHKRLSGGPGVRVSEEEMRICARAWSTWEMACSQLYPNPENIDHAADDEWNLAFARIESHYFVNGGFFTSPSQVIDDAVVIAKAGIPVTIVQGRYDLCCPPVTAWDLYKKIPHADFHLVDAAGHSWKEIGITRKLIETCDKYKKMFGIPA